MRSVLAGTLAAAAFSEQKSQMQIELQKMIDQMGTDAIGLQLGWRSANENFTIAAGSVTNPGASWRPITPSDTFNYGSGTKTTIATAVMRMADAGKLKLTDKVSTHVNPFLKRNNGTTLEALYGAQIADATILQVLRMEAGIPDFESAKGSSDIDSEALHSSGQVFPPYAWMRAASAQQPVCNPGDCSFYSSNGYEVAGLLVAAVQNPNGDWSDLDFGSAIGDSSLSRYPSMKLPAGEGKLKDTLSVAGISLRGGLTELWEQNPSIMGWSCGGMNANAGDFATFFYDLLDESSPHPLVSAAARKEMSNLKTLTTGDFKVDYGAGLMDSAAPHYNQPTTKGPGDWAYILGHIGETFAFHAVNGYMPKAKAAVSIVTNSDAGFGKVDIAACKTAEIAAKVIGGETIDLGCNSQPSFGRRRRTGRTSSDVPLSQKDVIV